MSNDQVIEILNQIKVYAERDKYNSRIYGSPESADREIEALNIAINYLKGC